MIYQYLFKIGFEWNNSNPALIVTDGYSPMCAQKLYAVWYSKETCPCLYFLTGQMSWNVAQTYFGQVTVVANMKRSD